MRVGTCPGQRMSRTREKQAIPQTYSRPCHTSFMSSRCAGYLSVSPWAATRVLSGKD